MRLVAIANGILDEVAIGGAERTVFELLPIWAKQCSLILLTTPQGRNAVERLAPDLSCSVVAIGRRPLAKTWISLLGQAARTSWHMLRIRSDLVWAASLYFWDVIPAVVAKVTLRSRRLAIRIPHIILKPGKRAGSRVVNMLAYAEQQLMLALGLVFADAFVVENEDLVRYLCGRGVTVDRVTVSGQGVNTYPAESVIDGKSDVLYVGRRSTAKGVPILAASWRRVLDVLPNARLILAGYDDIGFDSISCFKDFGSQSVYLIDRPTDGQITYLMQQTTVFAMPSIEEGFGRVILEAFGQGVPCITFDVPVFRLVFPGGRFVAADYTAAAFADAILLALSDSELRESIKSSIAAVPTRDWGSIGQETFDFLIRMLKD